MEKLIIDTNILYSWVKLSINNKLPPEKIDCIKKENELYIATPSIIEIIIKNRDNLSNIKTCLQPIINKDLLIVSIGFAPLSNELINKIYQANSIKDVSSEIEKILEMKITKEAEFLRFFFISIMFGIFHAIREEKKYKFDNEKEDKTFILLKNLLLQSNIELILNHFNIALIKGYRDNREDQTIKEVFSECILSMINIWFFNYHLVKSGVAFDSLENPDQEKIDLMREEMQKDKFYQNTIINYQENPFKITSKKKFHDILEEVNKEISLTMISKELMIDEVNDYIYQKLEKSFKSGAKINKNDIFDLLILYSLKLENAKLITLDTKLIKALKSAHQESFEYINSLGIY